MIALCHEKGIQEKLFFSRRIRGVNLAEVLSLVLALSQAVRVIIKIKFITNLVTEKLLAEAAVYQRVTNLYPFETFVVDGKQHLTVPLLICLFINHSNITLKENLSYYRVHCLLIKP